MAGERLGRLCEAATVLALQAAGVPDAELHWGPRPSGLTTRPDLLLGAEPERPQALLLVTHSSSAMQLHKKAWRNLGELLEAKTRLPGPPRVLSVVWGGARMARLDRVADAWFDRVVRVHELAGGPALEALLAELAPQGEGLGRQPLVELLCCRLPPEARATLLVLGQQLRAEPGRRHASLGQLWDELRSHGGQPEPAPPGLACNSSCKRGSAKLLLFSPGARALLHEAARTRRPVPRDELPLATALGLLGGLAGVFVIDPDLRRFARRWSLSTLELLEQEAPRAELERVAFGPLRAWPNLPVYADYVQRHFAALCQPAGMLAALEACAAEPGGLCPLPVAVDHHWLADYLLIVAKARRGGHNEYGQSQLALAAGVTQGITASGYRVFSSWLNRRQPARLPGAVLAAVARALAAELTATGAATLAGLSGPIRQAYLRTYLEIKLLCYEGYDPVGTLVRQWLAAQGMPYQEHRRFPSVFGELAGVHAATGRVLRTADGTAWCWCSGTAAGREHKRKELAGRVLGLRWTAHPELTRRPEILRTVLVLDGQWSGADVRHLRAAGWDAICPVDRLAEPER